MSIQLGLCKYKACDKHKRLIREEVIAIKIAFPIGLGVTRLREKTGLVRCKVPGSIRSKQNFEN